MDPRHASHIKNVQEDLNYDLRNAIVDRLERIRIAKGFTVVRFDSDLSEFSPEEKVILAYRLEENGDEQEFSEFDDEYFCNIDTSISVLDYSEYFDCFIYDETKKIWFIKTADQSKHQVIINPHDNLVNIRLLCYLESFFGLYDDNVDLSVHLKRCEVKQ